MPAIPAADPAALDQAAHPLRTQLLRGLQQRLSHITGGERLGDARPPFDATAVFFPAFSWKVATWSDLDLTTQSFWNDDGSDWSVHHSAMYLRIRWSN
jgi:hypothetical protein